MKTDWTKHGIPAIYAEKPYDVYPDKQRLVNLCLDFLDDKPIEFQNRWCLYLHGLPGCGKTHFACNALKAFIIKSRFNSAEFYTCKSYFALLQENFGDNIASINIQMKLKELDLLVIDDIGVYSGTDWQKEKINDLIEERYNSGRKTILSSNITLYENGHGKNGKTPFFDDRIYRRLMEGKIVPMEQSPFQGQVNAYQRDNQNDSINNLKLKELPKTNRMAYSDL